MEQIVGKKVRLISKKEEDKEVMPSVLSVILHQTHELFVSRKPSAKPNLLVWDVLASTTTPGPFFIFLL